jgi:hypothetical protein
LRLNNPPHLARKFIEKVIAITLLTLRAFVASEISGKTTISAMGWNANYIV